MLRKSGVGKYPLDKITISWLWSSAQPRFEVPDCSVLLQLVFKIQLSLERMYLVFQFSYSVFHITRGLCFPFAIRRLFTGIVTIPLLLPTTLDDGVPTRTVCLKWSLDHIFCPFLTGGNVTPYRKYSTEISHNVTFYHPFLWRGYYFRLFSSFLPIDPVK
jgi:hypothetical protein